MRHMISPGIFSLCQLILDFFYLFCKKTLIRSKNKAKLYSDRIIIFSAMSSFYFLFSNKLIFLEWLHPKKITVMQQHSKSIQLFQLCYIIYSLLIMLSYKNRLMINVYHDLPCYFYNPLNYKGIQDFDKISFKRVMTLINFHVVLYLYNGILCIFKD